MKKLMVLLMGVAVALSSCSKNEEALVASDSNVVTFTSDDIRTRVTDNVFDAGDVITVQAFSDGVAFASADYSYAGNSNEFSSTNPITYTGDEAVALSYEAVYPAVSSFASSFTHTIATDQSVAGAYESSDLLVATLDATTSLKPALSFLHTMSLVNITLVVNRDGVVSTTDAVSDVKVNAAVAAACNITEGSYAASGSVVEITPALSGSVYNVLVAPQKISAYGFVTATIGDTQFVMENTAATLASGYLYELTWTVDLATGSQSVEFTGVIEQWGTGVWGDDDSSSEDDDPVVDDNQTVITLDADVAGFPSEASSSTETIDVDGASFAYSNFYVNSSYGSFSTPSGSGSIYNLTALEGLSKIVVTEDYTYYNLTVYAGSEANPTATEIAYVANESDNTYTYTIPANYPYVSIVNVSTYTASADSIEFYFDSLGDTAELPESGASGSTVTIYAADWGLDNAEDVETTTLQGYTFSFAGSGTNAAKYYSGDNGTIRYYNGDVMTIKSVSGANISSIVFDTEGSMSVTSNVGTMDTSAKTWEGSASSVSFTASATTKIESLIITAE